MGQCVHKLAQKENIKIRIHNNAKIVLDVKIVREALIIVQNVMVALDS